MFSIKRLFSNRFAKPAWMIPIVLFLVLALSTGVLLGYRRYQANLNAEESTVASTSASSGERVNPTVDAALAAASEQAAIQASIQASKEAAIQAELAAKRAVLERDVIYEGITINDLPVGGQTRAMVTQMLAQHVEKVRAGFKVEISVDGKTLHLKPEEAGLTFDTEAIINQAYDIGRQATATTEPEQTLERFATVEALKQNPLKLSVSSTIDPEKVSQRISEWIRSMKNAPVDAKVTGFDLGSKTFKITEASAGVVIDAQAAAAKVIAQLNAGTYQIRETLDAKVTQPKVTAQALKDKLGFVSTAKTLAGSSSSSNRDHNISLAAKSINGYVVNPGETFSFNRVVGKRTADRGFRDAPAILGGILVPTIGGGICQAATTLYQAAMKADLEIVDRRPHSWPSGYTSIGLDATINWPSTDFKFRNNTNYPIAIVASFSKPNVVFSIYGRQLDAGVSINLKSVHNGYVDEPAPVYQVNPNLKPGAKVEIRQGRRGQRASAYKIWVKNGVEIRRELAATSYYRPIQAIYDMGPEVITTPSPTAGPTPTEPAPTGPAPTGPAPTGPAPTEPAPTEPAPTGPAPTEPAPTEPAPTEPAPTEPAPTEPAPTEPAPTEPAPTEPAAAQAP